MRSTTSRATARLARMATEAAMSLMSCSASGERITRIVLTERLQMFFYALECFLGNNTLAPGD